MSTSLGTSASRFSPGTQNMVVSGKQKEIQVMHTAEVLYFNVIHTDQVPQSHTRTDNFLPFLDLARGLWTRCCVDGGVEG